MELPSVAGEDGDDFGHFLVELGVDAETAIQRIRVARPGSIQTDIQEAYVRSCKLVITEQE
ncbi:MAG: hypothetical protein IIC11_08200 [Proteobacteria bacterium]|nr:hypothetical protein [Pseudomonadota bacterium]